MNIKIVFAIGLLSSPFAQANNYPNFNFYPENRCEEGRQSINIKAVSPKYVPVNVTRQMKNDGVFLSNFIDTRRVYFGNTYQGDMGYTLTNGPENNAYMNMTFPLSARGIQLLYTSSDPGRTICSIDEFYVQNLPKIESFNHNTNNNIINIKLNYSVDKYSKAGIEGKGVLISMRMKNVDNGAVFTTYTTNSALSGTASLSYGPGGGVYLVTVQVKDGTYFSSKQFTSYINGEVEPRCPECELY